MVGADGSLPLPWLAEPLAQALATQRGHAVLVHGPQGIGQFELALCLAQAWLCETPGGARKPCGHCASCRLVRARSHPDLLVLIPEALREALGWEEDGADGGSEKASKAKPSKDVKVEAVRGAVAFSQSTSARGVAKVVVVHPAERMNAISANTLLKTLEEPPGLARFVLSSGAPEALLPTIRSRCQAVPMVLPTAEAASAWLAGQGVAQPEVLLRACGGQPLEALDWSRQGVDAALWSNLPRLVSRAESAAFTGWPLARLVDALQKLCHDAACTAVGAAPRYFAAEALPRRGDLARLTAWARELRRFAASAEHPWNAGLALDSLLQQGRAALSVNSPA
jgi:DNA polymerase-3 subunit delta'